MRKNEWFYLHLLEQCLSADLQPRLRALEDLCKHEYLDLVPAQFLLDRLNSTSDWQEQRAILELMCQIEAPLPIEALMTILADSETSPLFLRMEVVHALTVVQAEESLLFDLIPFAFPTHIIFRSLAREEPVEPAKAI